MSNDSAETGDEPANLPWIPAVLVTNAYRDRSRLAPSDNAPPLGILADPAVSLSIIGIAYPDSFIGGATGRADPSAAAPPEVVWRLVLERAWTEGRAVRLAEKVTLDGRYVLRHGRFLELAEEAE